MEQQFQHRSDRVSVPDQPVEGHPASRLMLILTAGLLLVLSVFHIFTFSSPYPRLENVLYFSRLFSLYTLYAHIPVICLTAVLWLIGMAMGRWVLRRLAGEGATPLFDWPVALTVGWGVLAYAVMLLTFCHVLSLTSIAIVLVGAAAVARTEVHNLLRAAPGTLRHARECCAKHWCDATTPVRVLTVLACWLVLATFLSALMPPTQSDGLRYHITVPKANLMAGGLADLSHLSFSKFPMTVEMLFTIPLAFGLPAGAKLIHVTFFAICLGLVRRLVANPLVANPLVANPLVANPLAANATTIILLTVPFVPFLATWTFIELALTAVLLLAWYGFRMALHAEGTTRSHWLAVSALAGGLAMGAKYTSVINHAFLCCFVLLALEGGWLSRLRRAFGYGLLGTAVASPWYIKNYALTGNPVYPLAKGVFGSPGWSAFDNAFYFYHAGDKGSLSAVAEMTWGERLFDCLTLPFRVTCFPARFEGFGDWPIGVLPLALLPVILVTLGRARRERWLDLGYGVLLFLVWAYTYRDARFLLPCLAVLIPTLAEVVVGLWKSKAFRVSLVAALLSQGVWQTAMWFDMYRYSPWAIVGGQPVLDDRLTHGRSIGDYPSPVDGYLAAGSADTFNHYPSLLWIDANLPDSAVLYLHGLHTPFYVPRQAIWADWFDTEPLTDAARGGAPVTDLVTWLRSQGVTHVLYAHRIIADYNSRGNLSTYPPYYDLFSLPDNEGVQAVEDLRSLAVVRLRDREAWLQGMKDARAAIIKESREVGTLAALEELLNSGVLSTVYEDEFAAVLAVPTAPEIQETGVNPGVTR